MWNYPFCRWYFCFGRNTRTCIHNGTRNSEHNFKLHESCNKLHVKKSCYMYFNNTRKIENDEKLNNFVLEISNTSLPQVEHTKFLGVIIDNKLTWQPHLSSLVKKMSCCTGWLNCITQFIPADHHTNLYHTLFESYTEYQSGAVLNLPS